MVNADQSNTDVGFDPHATHFLIGNDGTYVATGVRKG